MEDKMTVEENRKTMFPHSHPPLCSPLPPICLSPLRNLSIPLSSAPALPLLLLLLLLFFLPPPPLSMWMALYHSASLSLSVRVCVQSCGRLETRIVENACVWVYRKTRLRRTMRELLELFCFVSMGTQHVLVCVCVHACVCVGGGGNKRAWVSMLSIVALLKRSMDEVY